MYTVSIVNNKEVFYVVWFRGLWWKQTFYENSVKVPAIISWPEKLPKGQILDNVINQFDINSTLLDIAGAPQLPRSHGQSMLSMLNNNGEIITGRAGMNWSRQIRPALGFSIAKMFYKRLKEYDGPSSNILSISECEKLARIYNLKLFYNNNICSFKKL